MLDPTKELNTAYIVKNKLHPCGVVIEAQGENINYCLDNDTDWDTVFESVEIKLADAGVWLWKGYITITEDSDIVKTTVLTKVASSFSFIINHMSR